jgi:hypothetical protein
LASKEQGVTFELEVSERDERARDPGPFLDTWLLAMGYSPVEGPHPGEDFLQGLPGRPEKSSNLGVA